MRRDGARAIAGAADIDAGENPRAARPVDIDRRAEQQHSAGMVEGRRGVDIDGRQPRAVPRALAEVGRIDQRRRKAERQRVGEQRCALALREPPEKGDVAEHIGAGRRDAPRRPVHVGPRPLRERGLREPCAVAAKPDIALGVARPVGGADRRHGPRHPERGEDEAAEREVVAHSRDALDDEGEHIIARVAVRKMAPRRRCRP